MSILNIKYQISNLINKMLDLLPTDLISIIIENLNYRDLYKFINTNCYINKHFSQYFKDKYYHIFVIKLVNNNLHTFRNKLVLLNSEQLNKVFIHTLNNIETVWLNNCQGFHNMKYILECMILGTTIDKNIISNMNARGLHFKKCFYDVLLKVVELEDRKSIQNKINNIPRLKSLHSTFIPYKKNLY
jgi:hypothetical protein